ncbi:hypothetical protein Taro_045117 [Colocasia esculenta]|uniref:Ketoreductase domain-containing protein n=1 Tax=Colocasia esculenta TaxID=4460 RepID=A0A843X248_COLES|nr:hypothetical protein [Colocasia esculenta]
MAAAGSSTREALPLQGRLAIVTGASRGIGRAIASHLADLGADVVIGYVSHADQAELLASQINGSSSGPPRALAVRVDVSVADDVKALFDRAEAAFGRRAHVLVNCAAVLDPGYPSVANTSLEAFERTFAVNARGTFLCCREAATRLARGGGGRVVTLSSSATTALGAGYGAYAASKAAAEAVTTVLAKELAGTGITANCLAPGPVATDMFYAGGAREEKERRAVALCPLGRLGEPMDVAHVVGFLVSDQGVWVNGQVILVNGGFV